MLEGKEGEREVVNSKADKNLSRFHIHEGLCKGLSYFSGPSRAAVIYTETPDAPMSIYDPQGLLRGHEPKFKKLYLDDDGWKDAGRNLDEIHVSCTVQPEKNLQLAGLISFGGRTPSIFYQMWFTEQHPDMCSIGPTERWLEHAACLMSHDFANEGAFHIGTARYVLQGYATHAVRDFIHDELNIKFGWDVHLEVYPILDAILGISKTPEEGSWPRGSLVFVEPDALPEIDFLIRFPLFERLKLRNHKHVRKLLLAVEHSERKLVSDGASIVGIAAGPMPKCRVTADYRGNYGFLKVAGNQICSFWDRRFHASTRQPKLVHFEEALIESNYDPSLSPVLLKIVMDIVSKAYSGHYGCSIIIDLDNSRSQASGQQIETPIDLREERSLELAKSLAKVDGALHIGADLHLHAFACLLDGLAIPGEDRARGARFNSALRFTTKHSNVIVIVVSSDRPVSVIHRGKDLAAQREWDLPPECISDPPTLQEWIDTAT